MICVFVDYSFCITNFCFPLFSLPLMPHPCIHAKQPTNRCKVCVHYRFGACNTASCILIMSTLWFILFSPDSSIFKQNVLGFSHVYVQRLSVMHSCCSCWNWLAFKLHHQEQYYHMFPCNSMHPGLFRCQLPRVRVHQVLIPLVDHSDHFITYQCFNQVKLKFKYDSINIYLVTFIILIFYLLSFSLMYQA